VRVRVTSAALNHLDLSWSKDACVTLALMGARGDGKGTIDAIGENAKARLMIGDRGDINPGIS